MKYLLAVKQTEEVLSGNALFACQLQVDLMTIKKNSPIAIIVYVTGVQTK